LKKQRETAAAIYCRLSRDDGTDSESNSIGNQREMLRRYAKENGFNVYSEYVDDGYTGTDFERPDFKRMIDDIEEGKVGIVLCKDLSRIGRNNALVAYYVEIFFVDRDIRLIALNDGIDSAKGENEIMGFKSILNEYYARDISKKIRSSRKTLAQQGKFYAAFPPYGYRKHPDDKHKLIVDDITGPTVKQIFDMTLKGLGTHVIADSLKKAKTPNPSAHLHQNHGVFHYGYDPDRPYDWSATTVASIIRNPLYTGDMVNHRQTVKSFKNHKVVWVPSDEWITVPDTHEALVDRDTFDKVQKIAATKKRDNSRRRENIFAGLLKCNDCKRNLSFTSDVRKSGGEGFYVCSGYRHQFQHIVEKKCTPHHITYRALYDSVLAQIQRLTSKAMAGGEGDFLQELLNSKRSSTVDGSKKTLNNLKLRSAELKRVIKKIAEQNANGVITDATFAEMYAGYQDELTTVTTRFDAIEAAVNEAKKGESDVQTFAGLIKKYENVSELTRDLLVDLIDRIEVHEATGSRYDGTRWLETDVYYRLIGAVDSLGGDGYQ